MDARPAEPVGYEDLYRAHYSRVLRLCRQLLQDTCEAEDVAQEVFLKLFRAQQSPHRSMAWGPWLTRVAVNACHDRQRSGWWRWWRAPRRGDRGKAMSDEVLSAAALLATRDEQPLTLEEEVLSREARRRIWQAFQELPSRQQEVFVLRYQEGWTTAAVADALGVSAGSVKRHLFRAVRHLRLTLGDRA